ncbi:MAG: ribonuclease III [Defluviitaleaceae bacterium]|nr:ribonuclease III [Defluviitaleaceae bacterium]
MFKEFEKKLGFKFKNTDLAEQAFTHSSYAHEKKMDPLKCNERLEFLGDAVLELIISEKLYLYYPNLPEGELTKFRATLVCEGSLARKALEMDLGKCLYIGKGEEMSGGRGRESTLADTFEAVLGAVFLDQGIEAAQKMVLELFDDDIVRGPKNFTGGDYKTALQEEVQKTDKDGVSYDIVSESGPAHDKTFVAIAIASANEIGRGSGKSKKEAEQDAAFKALKSMGFDLED